MLQSRKQFLKNAGLLIGAGSLFKHKVFSNYNLATCPSGICSLDLANTAVTPYTSVGVRLDKHYGMVLLPAMLNMLMKITQVTHVLMDIHFAKILMMP